MSVTISQRKTREPSKRRAKAYDLAPHINSHYFAAKRCLDIVLCLLLLPVILPLMVAISLAIYLESPGNVIFTQLRTGQHGHRFKMLKFRTMVVNAEELKATYAHLNILPSPDFKIPNDPRITRVGKILRKTSLDELPQLLNVLRGEMSLVGPRPTSFAADRYTLWHTVRLEVRPGMTGLWQVKGRNVTTFDERLRLDIEYIRTMSVWVDLKLLCMTVSAMFNRAGQ